MKTPRKIAALGAVVLAAVAGCDLSKQVTAKTVAVSTVLTTPEIRVPFEALAGNGFDASGLFPDAGVQFDGSFPFDAGGFDAGALLADAGVTFGDGGLTLPAQTLVYTFFGQRQGDNLDVAPVGMAGVDVVLSEVGGASWPLADQGGGNYALLGGDAGFTYRDLATYDFTMTQAGTTYVAEVARVPAQEHIARFHQDPGYLELDAGEALTFTRVEPAPEDELALGFINVFPVSMTGTQGQPTYSNVPKTPLEFLKLAVAPNDWKKLIVTIPGSAFPEADHNYVIVLQAAKLGGPKSDNLFAGSAILAGTADIAIVKTRR